MRTISIDFKLPCYPEGPIFVQDQLFGKVDFLLPCYPESPLFSDQKVNFFFVQGDPKTGGGSIGHI